MCRCFAEEFITSLPCTAVSPMLVRARTHTQTRACTYTIYAHSMPASNPDLSNKNNTLPFRILEIQTNNRLRWERGEKRKMGRRKSKNGMGLSGDANKRWWFDGDYEACMMTEWTPYQIIVF